MIVNKELKFIAKEDIHCYKALRKEDNSWRSPQNIFKKIELGETFYPEETEISKQDLGFGDFSIDSIYGGLVESFCNPIERKRYWTNGVCVFKAIIPKGSTFFLNIYASEIGSDKLVITEEEVLEEDLKVNVFPELLDISLPVLTKTGEQKKVDKIKEGEEIEGIIVRPGLIMSTSIKQERLKVRDCLPKMKDFWDYPTEEEFREIINNLTSISATHLLLGTIDEITQTRDNFGYFVTREGIIREGYSFLEDYKNILEDKGMEKINSFIISVKA